MIKTNMDKNRLHQLYKIENKTIRELSNILNCSEGTISNYVIKYGLTKRNRRKKYIDSDFVGRKIGRLNVISKSENEGYFNCLCECGNKILINRKIFINKPKSMKSCGCAKYVEYNIVPPYVWRNICKNGRCRKLDFTITLEQIEDLFLKQNEKCIFTGMKLEFYPQYKQTLTTASLDRIDSSKGYTIDNVQWIHKDINCMKNNYSDDYFIKMCKLVVRHNG